MCIRDSKRIRSKVHVPLVADIHFDHRLAIAAIEAGADKVRINPGNIGSEENVRKVIEHAKMKMCIRDRTSATPV